VSSAAQVIEIPYAPRTWARKLHASYARMAALVLHRRAGKTTAIVNHHQRAAMDDNWERARLRFLLPGAPEAHIRGLLAKRRIYWHVMPSLKQAKSVAWDMLKDASAPIPGVHVNISELEVTYPTGNKVRLMGADDPDGLRGPALAGLSLDEYSQIPSRAFGEVLSKALGDQVGYCIFSGTIKGKDQLYDTYQAAKDDPDWYAVWQDVDKSLATESGPTITALTRAMEDDRKLVLSGVITQAEYDQEWFLSPEAAIKGAIYGKELSTARTSGRITRVPHDPALPVDTDWDLGVGDSTAIWFTQSLRSGEVRVIDFHEASGEGFSYYARVLKEKANERGYTYGTHWGPHDIVVREMGTGKSRVETAREHGIKFEVTPRIMGSEKGEVEEGINAVRNLLPRCWFDEKGCEAGLEALRHYRRDFNARLDEFKPTPVHDWSSHAADAFRGLAVRHQVPREKKKQAAASMPATFNWS
jgi:phage terminase large subunit